MRVEMNGLPVAGIKTERNVEKSAIMVIDEKRDKQRAKYIWSCEICGRCLCSKRSYSEHKNTHNSARPFKCESCDYAAASQMTLRRHTLRQHVPRSNWHYPCPYCEQAFVEPTSYQAHLRHKHAGYSGTFGCDKCDYKTLSSKNFVDHILKHAHVRTKKRPSPKTMKDFTDREFICKCLVNDELGVGWGQRPVGTGIDEQELSLRRIAAAEQERRRRTAPFISAVFSTASNQQTRLRVGARPISTAQGYGDMISEEPARTRTSRVVGSSSDYDHEYQASISNPSTSTNSSSGRLVVRGTGTRSRIVPLFPNFGHERKNTSRTSQPSTSSIEQTYPVPEAESYVEVESEVYSSIVEDGENEASSTSDSGTDNEDDDDSGSCSSGNSVEIGLRLTALTAQIEAQKGIIFDDPCEQECQDLGNDVLPDGQVDFDLD